MEQVSVIICCYNSANRIYDTLLHLGKQDTWGINWELLIINNASTDDTGKSAAEAWEKVGIKSVPFRVIDEPMPGLVHARKRGILEAVSDLIIFCDDDNWLYPDYIYNAYTIAQQNPGLGVFSPSKCYGVYEVAPKEWFLKRKDMVAVYDVDLDKTASCADDDVFCGGAGMCMDRTFGLHYIEYTKDNYLRTMLDRKEGNLLSGGDTDLNYVAYELGYKTGLFNSLRLQHYIPKQRINRKYLLKLKYSMAYSHILLHHINNRETNKWTVGGWIKHIFTTLMDDPFEVLMSINALIATNRAKKMINRLKK